MLSQGPGQAGTGRAAWAGVVAALLATAALAGWAVFATLTRAQIDFRVYYLAAVVWAHGGSPYSMPRADWFAFGHHLGLKDFVWPYRYAPYTAALLRPFLAAGEPAIRAVWQAARNGRRRAAV